MLIEFPIVNRVSALWETNFFPIPVRAPQRCRKMEQPGADLGRKDFQSPTLDLL